MRHEPPKAFKLVKRDMCLLVQGIGACIASDKITVAGLPIVYMYRVDPTPGIDSGWRFLSDDEPEDRFGSWNQDTFDVNVIANYDPSIIPLLSSPPGSVFKRPIGLHAFEPTAEWPESPGEQ